jgi:hypothetical protein
MGADVHLMNILPLFNVSAFNGLLCYKSPTSATLEPLAAMADEQTVTALLSKIKLLLFMTMTHFRLTVRL